MLAETRHNVVLMNSGDLSKINIMLDGGGVASLFVAIGPILTGTSSSGDLL
jgi:hypothetical protein